MDSEKSPGMVDGQFRRSTREAVEEVKRVLHANIESMFADIEYDHKDGRAINNIEVSSGREFERLGIGTERSVIVPKSTTLTIKVDMTVQQFCAALQAELDRK